MDPNNPVVKLCVEGMRAESEGRPGEARTLFQQAWAKRTGALDGCIAAHYVARHQESSDDVLWWNEEALRCADAAGDESVREFYPSLYLNMGHSHEMLGHWDEATKYYQLAAERLNELPAGPYGDVVRGGVARARERMANRD